MKNKRELIDNIRSVILDVLDELKPINIAGCEILSDVIHNTVEDAVLSYIKNDGELSKRIDDYTNRC